MKKVLWVIVCLMTMVLSSCSSTYIVTANYDVCYPDGVKNYNEKILFSSWNEPTVKCYSIFGTNYISVVGNNATLPNGKSMKSETLFKSSTAPMRLNSFYVENTKKKNTAHKVKNKDYIYITMNDILSH
jgi:hypothetical protein